VSLKANLLDRAISYVAPVAGARRIAARNALASARMIYDGAARSPRTAFRKAGATSANTEIQMGLPRLRDVSRDLGRNNPIAANIHAAIPANVVGAGIIPQVKSTNKKAKGGDPDADRKPPRHAGDRFRRPRQFLRAAKPGDALVVESGDALIVRRYVPPPSLRLAVPLQIRVLEGDYLDHLKSGPIENGNTCFQGIECDANGQRVAYWLFDEHPGGGVTWKCPKSRRVDAADVFHLYRQDRPGQMRGNPVGRCRHHDDVGPRRL
jgi:capsid protein